MELVIFQAFAKLVIKVPTRIRRYGGQEGQTYLLDSVIVGGLIHHVYVRIDYFGLSGYKG